MSMNYILFDDCYMSTVEVAYDLREVTNYLIASTSEMMAYGMPYHKILKYIIGLNLAMLRWLKNSSTSTNHIIAHTALLA